MEMQDDTNPGFFHTTRALGLAQVAIMSIIGSSPQRAFGTGIAKAMTDMSGREVADAQVFVALRRLERQGFVASTTKHDPEPSKRTRGRPRLFYELTASGLRALEAAGAYANLASAGQFVSKESKDGRTKETPDLTPVVG